MEAVILTGATSMIGAAIIKKYIAKNVQIYAIAHKNSKNINRIPSSPLVTVIPCDIEEMSNFDCNRIPVKPEIFFDIGWGGTDKLGRDRCRTQAENIVYCLDSVQLAAKLGCRKFVGAGSQAEFGRTNCALNMNVPSNPETPYGIAKYAAEKMTKIECGNLGLEFNWIRILSIYGPNDRESNLTKSFIKNCLENKEMALGPCTHQWDYLFEDDAAEAFVAVGEKGTNGKTYCLGSGNAKPLKEYLEKIRQIVNPNYNGAKYGAIPYTENSIQYLEADISELVNDTGWRPKTTFEEGIKRMINSFCLC